MVPPKTRKRKATLQLLKKTNPAYVKGAIACYGGNRELKYKDIVQGLTAISATTTQVVLLNGIAQGDDNTNRDGRQACMQAVQLRFRLANVYGTPPTLQTIIRLVLVWDNAPNSGTIPTLADIFDTSTALTTDNVPKIDNANRFTILKDDVVVMGPYVYSTTATQSLAASDRVNAYHEMYKKLGLVTQYSGTGATVASIQNGALYLCYWNDQAIAGTNPQMAYTSRCRFTDD